MWEEEGETAAWLGCPAGLAGGSAGGGRPSIHLSVLGDAMALAGSANPARSHWVRGAGSRLVLAVPQQIQLCTVPGPPWLGLGAPGLCLGFGERRRPWKLHPLPLPPALEAGKRRGRAPAEMDES